MRMRHLLISAFGEFQAPPIGLEYELQRFQSFSVDQYGCNYSWNDVKKDGGKKDHIGTCGQGLNLSLVVSGQESSKESPVKLWSIHYLATAS